MCVCMCVCVCVCRSGEVEDEELYDDVAVIAPPISRPPPVSSFNKPPAEAPPAVPSLPPPNKQRQNSGSEVRLQTDRQTGGQADRQTDRQVGRQTDRQTDSLLFCQLT